MKMLITLLLFLNVMKASSQKLWTSPTYSYSILTPPNFVNSPATGSHLDYKVINKDGTSILVNVSPRAPNEYNFTPHDYTRTLLQNELSDVKIVAFEKVLIDNQKALLYQFVRDDKKCIECLIFVGSKVFMITATTEATYFNIYSKVFIKTIKSIKF